VIASVMSIRLESSLEAAVYKAAAHDLPVGL